MKKKKIKCVVWDLDNTIWDGTLLEDKTVTLKEGIRDIMLELDNRGVLQSISSKNNYEDAMNKLKEFQIADFFIYPQISWDVKSKSIGMIAKNINIGLDTIAFIDDQVFERDEVNFTYKEVMCIDASDINQLLDREEFKPSYYTQDSKMRRIYYQNDIIRNQVENEFLGSQEDFLQSLRMVLTVSKAKEQDLKRVEELTVRTHQLNSTGYTYSYEELREMLNSDEYDLYVTQLDDIYGEYGKIGLALVEKKDRLWELKLLLMSCRVMSRGVGSVLLYYIMNQAREKKVQLRSFFIPTDRNRTMYVTYKFGGFREVDKKGELLILEADLSKEKIIPDYITLIER